MEFTTSHSTANNQKVQFLTKPNKENLIKVTKLHKNREQSTENNQFDLKIQVKKIKASIFGKTPKTGNSNFSDLGRNVIENTYSEYKLN